MPEINANGVRLHYTEAGSGPSVVVLSHSYLVDHRQFDHQIAALSQRFRVIAYDHRDHGRSGRVPGRYTLDDITTDGIALLEALGLPPVHWIGLSTGGFVGMRIALRRPELLRSLVLMDTSGAEEPRLNRLKYQGLFAVLRRAGFSPVIAPAMASLFGPEFLRDPAQAASRSLWQERIEALEPEAIIRFGNAIFARGNILRSLRDVSLPTRVVVGEQDKATPLSKAKLLVEAIPGASLSVIARAGHLSTIEQPAAVTAVLQDFYEGLSAS